MASDLEMGVTVNDPKVRKLGCASCLCACILAFLITVLASIHELGPEEQMLVKDPSEHWIKNGPWRGVLFNVYAKEFRKATVLKPEEYAVVDDFLNGQPRHEEGPQLFFLGAYEELVEVRPKIVLHKDMYAVLKNDMTGEPRHEEGPGLVFPGVYDKLVRVVPKYVLQKDEYLITADQITGAERVISGPQTFVPEPLEEPRLVAGTNGTWRRKAIFLDDETAVLVLDRSTGRQRLVQRVDLDGLFIPAAYEEVLAVRPLVRVLPHESVVVRDTQGRLTVRSGADGDGLGMSFFLQPYSELLEMTWSNYQDLPEPGATEGPETVTLTTIDMRAKKMMFQYEVRTNDNVKLVLQGTIFWQVIDVAKMIQATADPESDVWHHARSALIEAVSNSTLAEFMSTFNVIIRDAWARQSRAEFYLTRGLELQSMELTRFDCADSETATILQEIIQETTNRINRLTAQESENEVRAAKLTMDIKLEKQKRQLIQTKAENDRLQSQMEGEADGMKLVNSAAAFLDGLNSSVPSVAKRVDLYKLHQNLQSRNTDTKNLASGSAHLFLTPEDLKLKLSMGAGTHSDATEL